MHVKTINLCTQSSWYKLDNSINQNIIVKVAYKMNKKISTLEIDWLLFFVEESVIKT